jgi:hypothetical protein
LIKNVIFNKKIMKPIVVFLFFAVCLKSHAQKVFSTQYDNQADVKVFVVDYENEADLKVYKVKYSNQTTKNEGLWFFTEYDNQAEKKIFFVKYENQADLKIFFVPYSNQAGWANNAKKPLFY